MTGGQGDELDESERLKELGHLSAAVGHHVINAFAAVVSNAELIRSQARNPQCDRDELVALGSAIIENALGASHVPRRLIDWTRRFTSPGFDQKIDPVVLIDLNQVIRETVEHQQATGAPGITWVLNLGDIPMIRGSASQIRSLLAYLIQNAREAMPRGVGTITCSTTVDERNWVIMEIRDSGSGMMPEVLKRATEPFFTTKSGRSGVGLTAAHGIWRRHRGALSIESQPGEGTMIRLSVEAPPPSATHPVSKAEAAPTARQSASFSRDATPTSAGPRPSASSGTPGPA